MSGCLIQSSISLADASKLRDYYIRQFKINNWMLVDAADGPNGFNDVYKKEQDFFSLNFLNRNMIVFYGK